MKKTFLCFLFITVYITLGSCEKDSDSSNEIFMIEFGSECGWCAGKEYISISETTIKYVRTIPCDENQGVTQKSKSITTARWDSICSSFDYNKFKKLEYNECNVCVDGCDEIIKITQNRTEQQLRYAPGEEIEGIKNLRQILAGIMIEMQNQN